VTSSAQKSILIITEKFDPHADHVIRALKSDGIAFYRLNTNDLHEEIKIEASSTAASIRFEDQQGRVHRFPDETRSVWYRKPVDPNPPQTITDPPTRALILAETLELLTYLSVERRVPWFNNPHDNRFSQRKFPQILLAQEFGLRVPRTLITNDPARVRAFGREVEGRLLCKSMKEQGFRDEKDGYFIFSRKVSSEEFEQHADQVAHCPTLFQQYIEKAFELRITIIGDELFCCRINSQAAKGAETDWRRIDPSQVEHQIVPLPAEIEAPLRRMLGHYGLRYGAFDMIVTPEGEYVFLELNPNGQWLWIELITGAEMTRAVVRMLTT
jgi:glutathione synthase/RimK-type ligase-like ATP-grasp enzyme